MSVFILNYVFLFRLTLLEPCALPLNEKFPPYRLAQLSLV